MDGQRRDTVLSQLFDQPVSTVLGAGEHQYLEPVMLLDQVGEQVALSFPIHRVHLLHHRVSGGVAGCHLDHCGAVEQPSGEYLDLVGECCKEQQVLPLLGQQCQDAADVADKTHVQHPVGFIQHEDLDTR